MGYALGEREGLGDQRTSEPYVHLDVNVSKTRGDQLRTFMDKYGMELSEAVAWALGAGLDLDLLEEQRATAGADAMSAPIHMPDGTNRKITSALPEARLSWG